MKYGSSAYTHFHTNSASHQLVFYLFILNASLGRFKCKCSPNRLDIRVLNMPAQRAKEKQKFLLPTLTWNPKSHLARVTPVSCSVLCMRQSWQNKVGRVCRFNMWKDLWLCLSFHSKEIGGFIVMVEFTPFIHLMMIHFPWEFVLFCMLCLFWDLHGTKNIQPSVTV